MWNMSNRQFRRWSVPPRLTPATSTCSLHRGPGRGLVDRDGGRLGFIWVTHTDLYGEEENLFGEENPSFSSKPGLTPPSSASISQVPLESWWQELQQQNPDFLHMALPKARRAEGERRGLSNQVSFPWQEAMTEETYGNALFCSHQMLLSHFPNQRLCPHAEQLLPSTLDLSDLQPTCLSACVTSQRYNTKLKTHEAAEGGLLDRNIQDFFENLARGLLTRHFSRYFVQDELIGTHKWQ